MNKKVFAGRSFCVFLILPHLTFMILVNYAGGRLRHAFIGIGFRERPQAYDFQAALHDHKK